MSIHKSARFSAFPGRGDLARRAAPTFTLAARFIRLAARSQPASQPAFDPDSRSKPGGSRSTENLDFRFICSPLTRIYGLRTAETLIRCQILWPRSPPPLKDIEASKIRRRNFVKKRPSLERFHKFYRISQQ